MDEQATLGPHPTSRVTITENAIIITEATRSIMPHHPQKKTRSKKKTNSNYGISADFERHTKRASLQVAPLTAKALEHTTAAFVGNKKMVLTGTLSDGYIYVEHSSL